MSLFFSTSYLLGDSNIDFLCANHPFYNKLLSVVSSFDLTQIVLEPTRISSSTATLIDLIFVSFPAQVESCSTIPPSANCDHSGLHLTIIINYSKEQ